jgi:hypothetical protein
MGMFGEGRPSEARDGSSWRSRYHVYYAPLDDALVVLAVWHASRGTGPPLRLK